MVKIITDDGTAERTKVIDEKSGVEITGINYMSVVFLPGELVKARIDVIAPKASLIIDNKEVTFICGKCKSVMKKEGEGGLHL